MLSVLAEDVDEDFMRFLLKTRQFRTVRKKPRSTRRRFGEVVSSLTDVDFRRAFRMYRDTFQKLLELVAPYLTRNGSMALRSSAGAIEPDVRLAIMLRKLAGARIWTRCLSGRSVALWSLKSSWNRYELLSK